jgi:hypothetical protein
MWTCASCATSNEAHAIFCASCGAMRYKAPLREPASPEPEPIPTALPEYSGTAAGLTAAWVGAALAAGFGALMTQSLFSGVVRFVPSPTPWALFAVRMGMGVSFGFVYGALLGALQSWALRRRLSRPGWGAWTFATLGGIVLLSVGSNLLPPAMWGQGGLVSRLPTAALLGLVGGGLVGLLQSRVLGRLLGAGGWTAWWLVSAGGYAIGNVAGLLAWHSVFDETAFSTARLFAAGLAHTVADSGLTALLTGPFLARLLRRRCAPPP